MDPALKQRMLGAFVLIALAIIFVPLLLNRQDKSTAENIDLSIPKPPERDFDTQVVPLVLPDNSATETNTSPETDPNRIATVDTQATQKIDALSGESNSADPLPEQPPINQTTDAHINPLTTATSTQNASDNKTSAPSADMSSIPNTNKPSATAVGRYVLNLGSYSKRENADALVAQLKKKGVLVYSEKINLNGESAIRLRAGPFADRTEAEKARLISKQTRPDITSSIVEITEQTTQDVTERDVGSRAIAWAVQIGAFALQTDAQTQRERLIKNGWPAYIESIRTEQGILYRVRVGPETRRERAEKIRTEVKTRLGLNGQIVPHP
jgi:DedD protein